MLPVPNNTPNVAAGLTASVSAVNLELEQYEGEALVQAPQKEHSVIDMEGPCGSFDELDLK